MNLEFCTFTVQKTKIHVECADHSFYKKEQKNWCGLNICVLAVKTCFNQIRYEHPHQQERQHSYLSLDAVKVLFQYQD